mmetsp:Transcript_30238/g.80643  ORF Transcript_30238/g.80643 Transcript_30238/m.80643 type:complete len:81 (-) Transcript_30238:1549-1791(-)
MLAPPSLDTVVVISGSDVEGLVPRSDVGALLSPLVVDVPLLDVKVILPVVDSNVLPLVVLHAKVVPGDDVGIGAVIALVE